MKPELPRYRLLEPAFLQPARHVAASRFEAGSEIAFEGTPTFAMVPLNAPAFAAKAASIRALGMGRLRNPSAGDRSTLITLVESIGGHRAPVDQMADQLEQWLANNPIPQQEVKP